jgi:N-methylhydantoinase A
VRSCDPEATVLTEAKAYMRYKGQGWEIPVALPGDLAQHPTAEGLHARFAADYAALFGRTVEGLPVEVTVWAVNAATPLAEVAPTPEPPAGPEVAGVARRLFDPVAGAWAEARAVERRAVSDGATVPGPAAITEAETTVIVPRGFTVTGRADGCLDLRRGA